MSRVPSHDEKTDIRAIEVMVSNDVVRKVEAYGLVIMLSYPLIFGDAYPKEYHCILDGDLRKWHEAGLVSIDECIYIIDHIVYKDDLMVMMRNYAAERCDRAFC